MDPWIETFYVVIIASAGIYTGRKASRLANPWWAYVLAVPLLMLGLLVVMACTTLLDGVAPLFFITAGRARYVILSMAVTFGLMTPLSRLPYRIEQVVVCLLMAVFVSFFSILPFLAPALIRKDLSRIETRFDANGVCYQSKSYTCGPAAAVTALAKFGFPAEEGQIAVLARTNPVSGTLLWTLYSVLKNHYAPQGLNCQFRRFDHVDQLRDIGITLVSIREAAMFDHCVAVLNVSDTDVTIADPVAGLEVIPLQDFDAIWRRCGIVINRIDELSRL